MSVLAHLLSDLPSGWRTGDIYVGTNWTLARVTSRGGVRQAGVASTPKQTSATSRFQPGHHTPDSSAAHTARLLLSNDETEAAVGLAVLNALNQPGEAQLTAMDAADWLAEQCHNRRAAFFGRFPFIEGEIRPAAKQVCIFEQPPQSDEYSMEDIQRVLPEMDVIAITGSSIINHTIDAILYHVRPGSLVAVLGPSTPLTPALFRSGIDAMFGVYVSQVEEAIESVMAGDGFQKMRGLKRVALFRSHT